MPPSNPQPVTVDPLHEFFVSETERQDVLSAYHLQSQALEERHDFLRFSLGNEHYAFDIHVIREIIRVPILTSVPRTARWLLGITNLRGEMVPVVCLGTVLERPSVRPTTQGHRILVCADPTGAFGFVVDRVFDVLRISASAIEPATGKLSDPLGWISGIIHWNEDVVYVMNTAKLFIALETLQ